MTRTDPTAQSRSTQAPTRRTFLDRAGSSPVADPELGTIYPRLSERIESALRNPSPDRAQQRILVKGPARCGKSSLVAHALRRLPERRVAVLTGPFDAVALLDTVVEGLDDDGARQELHAIELSPPPIDELEDLLVGQLNRLCTAERPLAIVLDPIDALLRTNDTAPRRLNSECHGPVVLLFRALERTRGAVDVIATSREVFTILDRGKDLADDFTIIEVELPEPTGIRHLIDTSLSGSGADEELEKRIHRVALGHPRLIDLLSRLAWTMPEPLSSALATLEAYLDGRGDVPREEITEVTAFFESLIFERLLLGLSTPERDLLRLSTSFVTPAPVAIVEEFARRFGLLEDSVPESGELADSRLAHLGLWDFLWRDDPGDPGNTALHLVPNPIARQRAGTLDDEERPAVAMHLVQLFIDAWLSGDELPEDARCYQLSRLAVHAADPQILNRALPGALRHLQRRLSDEQAVQLANQAVQLLGTSQYQPTSEVLMAAADLSFRRADFSSGSTFLERALPLSDRDPSQEACFKRALAAAKAADGDLSTAQDLLEEAVAGFETDARPWDAMATLEVLADVHVASEDLSEATRARERELGLAKSLGATRRALSALGHLGKLYSALGEQEKSLRSHHAALDQSRDLDDPALMAQIQGEVAREMMEQGDFDGALQLQQERLSHFEAVGDPAGRAHALWSSARVELRRSRIDAAMGLLVEAYHINLELDQLDGIGLVGLDYGQVLWAAGMMGEARLILERSVGSFRRLGDAQLTQHAQSILEELTTAS